MPTYIDVTIRALFTYVTLWALTRLMGKKEISQMTFFDYIVGITIGSIGAQLATNLNTAWPQMIPAALVFSLLQIVLSYTSQKSIKFRKIVNGSPRVLIEKGKIMEENLVKERITITELMAKLRERNAYKLADVETAILEVDGQISVQLKAEKLPVTPTDMKIKVQSSGLPRLVIEDGNILGESLKDLKLTRAWLLSKLAEQNIHDPSSVMIAQVDTSGSIYVDLYEDKL